MMPIKFHPSRVGLLMTDAKAIDPALLVGDFLEISKKKVKTEADKALLEPLWDMTLSQGAKTELKSIESVVLIHLLNRYQRHQKEIEYKQNDRAFYHRY